MKNLILVLGVLFTVSSFADPICTEAMMKAAYKIDVRSDTGQAGAEIDNEISSDQSSITFMFGSFASANTIVGFSGVNGLRCQITVKGVALGFMIPQSFASTPTGQLTIPMLLGCAEKLSKAPAPGGVVALDGMTVYSSSGKTLGDLGITFNTTANTIGFVTLISQPAVGGFSCAR